MDATKLRARARQEAEELGPEPPARKVELWREERWGAVVLLRRCGPTCVRRSLADSGSVTRVRGPEEI